MTKINILLIEDDSNDKVLIEKAIRKMKYNVQLETISTKPEISKIDLQKYDLVICDYVLDGFDASFVLETLQNKSCEIPIIILSGRIGEDVAVQAMKNGAWDYIMKDKLSLLEPAIERSLSLYQSKRLLKAQEQEVMNSRQHQATSILAAGVIHDINNILGAFSIGLGLLEEKVNSKNTSAIMDHLRSLKSTIEQGTAMSKNLLALSKNDQVGIVSSIPVQSTIVKMLPFFETMLNNKAQLDFHKSEQDYIVKLKLGHLEQILINLISNARDAVKTDGHIKIKSHHEKEKETTWWVLEVHDNGSGIPADMLGKIFSPFYSTKGQKGYGLGLYNIKNIVEQNNGEIKTFNNQDHGACFQVRFPAQVVQDTNLRDIQEAIDLSEKSILLIEDDTNLNDIIHDYLKEHSFGVTRPSKIDMDSVQGLDLSKVQIAIIDLNLKANSGIEIAKEIKKRKPEIKIIIISGFISQSASIQINQYNYHSLEKPFTGSELVRKIKQIST